jgi:hypothetical protein
MQKLVVVLLTIIAVQLGVITARLQPPRVQAQAPAEYRLLQGLYNEQRLNQFAREGWQPVAMAVDFPNFFILLRKP